MRRLLQAVAVGPLLASGASARALQLRQSEHLLLQQEQQSVPQWPWELKVGSTDLHRQAPTAELSTPAAAEGYPLAGTSGHLQVGTLAIVAILIVCTGIHEFRVGICGAAPVLDGHLSVSQANLFVWMFMMAADNTVIIPTSYSIATAMSSTALASGLLIGSGFWLAPPVVFLASHWFKSRSQYFSRLVGLIGILFLIAQSLGYAIFLDSRPADGAWGMNVLIAIRFLGRGVGNVSFILQYMTYKMTPKASMTTLSILAAASTNAGLCAGPLLSSTMSAILDSGGDTFSPYMAGAAPLYMLTIMWCALMLAVCMSTPVTLASDNACEVESNASSQATPRGGPPLSPRANAKHRQTLVVCALVYTMERGFTVSAIEAGTALLLEWQYVWTPEKIGFAIGCVFAATVVLSLAFVAIRSMCHVRELPALIVMVSVAAMGAMLLFDWPLNSPLQLLAADAIVYPFVYTANGVVDGLATSMAVPKTWYSAENYLAARAALQTVLRGIAPPVARSCIALGGRNLYAGLQVFLGVVGVISAIKLADSVGKIRSGAPDCNDVLEKG